MLKFWHHKYNLQPVGALGALASEKPREGALLKIQWPDKKVGYADLFPWPELGDLVLEAQLEELSRGRLNYLAEQAIWLARKDANLRAEKKNAFQGLPKIKNHFLISDPKLVTDTLVTEIKSMGFSTVKIKLGRNLEEEATWIDKFMRAQPFMVRLDLNSKGSPASFENFVSRIGLPVRPRIEYVEDPMPYNHENWMAASKLLPIALDNEFYKIDWSSMKAPLPFKVVVIKPARQDVKTTVDHVNKFGLKMVIASSLDHPVGIAHAVFTAGGLKKFYPNTLLDCGCLSLRAYKANDFSTSMIVQGPFLQDVAGTGIGFDSLFEKIQWTPL